MAKRQSFAALLGLAVLGLSWCLPAARAVRAATGAAEARLGRVEFPNSCSPDAQPLIEKGVALLHSFQYQEAQQTFEELQKKNAYCATAHWGKAMSLYHQLWDFPDDTKMKQGHNEIQQAQKLSSSNPNEEGLIAAAAAFYQNKSRMSHEKHTKAYSAALAKLHAKFPDDVEISSFYALSLVALAEQGVDSLANQKKAIAILQPLLEKYPDHPGVAHYLIHAADRPELAPEGFEAARRYAAIAPDSPHALHMPSHIFVRLGLWQDSITSNIASEAAAARLAELHNAESHYQTHAMDYLNYSYLQSGQEAKAREVIRHVDQVVGASDEDKTDQRAFLLARSSVELHRWKDAAALEDPPLRKDQQDTTRWARAIGAARSGDAPRAELAVKQLAESVAEREDRARKQGYPPPTEKATDLEEAEAWLAFANGKSEEALKELRAAAERQEKNGGESTVVPAREMLADMLMELKRSADALTEYKTVLTNAPNRFDGLLGAARAAQATGDTSGAQSFYAKLTEVCPAGADRPELAEAKTFVATK